MADLISVIVPVYNVAEDLPRCLDSILAQHYLTTCGCSIPEDVSFIGFEDRYISQYLNPPQTCVEQRMDQLASTAIDTLEKQLQGKHDPKDVCIPCNLIIRDTVAPPK